MTAEKFIEAKAIQERVNELKNEIKMLRDIKTPETKFSIITRVSYNLRFYERHFVSDADVTINDPYFMRDIINKIISQYEKEMEQLLRKFNEL